MQKYIIPFGAVFLGGLFYLAGQTVSTDYASTISVQGVGRVYMTPDIGVLNLGVSTGRQPTTEAVIESLSESMDAITAALKENGVDEKDITTQSFYMNPAYDWTDGGQIPRGFEATQSLMVKVRDRGKLSDVLGAATKAGANQVNGITFTVESPETVKRQAREKAIADAQEQAQKLADQLGVRLGEITSFTEGYTNGATPYMYDTAQTGGLGGGGGPSIPVGEQEVVIEVNIGYEIK